MKNYTVIVRVGLPDDKAKEIESWGEDISCDTFIHSIIVDHIRDRGVIAKAIVHDVDVYDPLNEHAVKLKRELTLVDLENEVLSSKACINGTCED